MLDGLKLVDDFAMFMTEFDQNFTMARATVIVSTNWLAGTAQVSSSTNNSLSRQEQKERLILDVLDNTWRECRSVTVNTMLGQSVADQSKHIMQGKRWETILDFYNAREDLIKKLIRGLRLRK